MSDDPRHIRVVVSNQQEIEIDEERVEEVALSTARAEGAIGEISVLVVDPASIAELNSRFLGEEGPTDVLAFPVDGLISTPGAAPVLIGEIAVCPEVAGSDLDLVVAHGVLHLLGFDHTDEAGAAEMRKREFHASGHSGARAT